MAVIPGKIISVLNDPDKNWKETFQKVAKLQLWEHYWTKFIGFRPNNISETLKSISKTYSRSTMVTDRLNGIALIHLHQEINQDVSKVIDLSSTNDRRRKGT